MGSWSVYCNFSKITITSGTPCVLVPLRKVELEYHRYMCYTLPIFGTYNDYGGIEDIKRDFNTDLIEKIHGCSIENFCQYLIDKEIEPETDDEDNTDIEEKLETLLSDIEYTWIHGEVYEFLAKTYRPTGFRRAECFDFGNQQILEKLGFVYVGASGDSRYKKLFKYQEHSLASDGTWGHFIVNDKHVSCYNLTDLKKMIPDLDVSYFENKEEGDLFELYDRDKRFEKLYFPLGYDRSLLSMLAMKEMVAVSRIARGEEVENINDMLLKHMQMNAMQEEYLKLFESSHEFCQTMSDLIRLVRNGQSYSQQFEPYVLYITPQCGEFEIHQNILEKFATINKEHISS